MSSKILSSSLSQQAAMAALSACTKLGYQVGVAVVDRNGNLLAFVRDPLAGPHTIELSDKKAFTSASTRVSTRALKNQHTLNFSERLITVKGGLPISIAGYVYGGIGVSGATSEDDEVCAQAGIDAISEEIEFSQ
ncbi:MAG: heme-binding protein [Gammaproteobacteria bacterium]|nr:heme-binding protein [Gammaproteobacteria bacterium]